jgi:hypothetical protein
MHAFLNHRSSCFMDTVLVAMFASTPAFDGLTSGPTPLAHELRAELRRLRGGAAHRVTRLRTLMGSPWDNGTPQSAVDFLHALFDKLGVKQVGWQTHRIAYVPRARAAHPADIRTSEREGFRIHLAVAGQHPSLSSLFERTETVLPPHAESHSTLSSIMLMDAPLLIFEVGRTAGATHRVEYGITGADGRIFMQVGRVEYTLVGVVCRTGGHYVGFVWGPKSGWGSYDDMHPQGAILDVDHPEFHSGRAPSRFGELFFFVQNTTA